MESLFGCGLGGLSRLVSLPVLLLFAVLSWILSLYPVVFFFSV